MPAPRKYPDELRDRAVRLVREDGQHGAIARVADRLDINRETLRNWVKGERRRREEPEVVDLEAENARLRKENAELERANEILKSASAFFASISTTSGTAGLGSATPRTVTVGSPTSSWHMRVASVSAGVLFEMWS